MNDDQENIKDDSNQDDPNLKQLSEGKMLKIRFEIVIGCVQSKIEYLGHSFHIAYSNKLGELILNVNRVWLFFAILIGKNPFSLYTNSESSHRACSNELQASLRVMVQAYLIK